MGEKNENNAILNSVAVKVEVEVELDKNFIWYFLQLPYLSTENRSQDTMILELFSHSFTLLS